MLSTPVLRREPDHAPDLLKGNGTAPLFIECASGGLWTQASYFQKGYSMNDADSLKEISTAEHVFEMAREATHRAAVAAEGRSRAAGLPSS
jgi:hypothetical protein